MDFVVVVYGLIVVSTFLVDYSVRISAQTHARSFVQHSPVSKTDNLSSSDVANIEEKI